MRSDVYLKVLKGQVIPLVELFSLMTQDNNSRIPGVQIMKEWFREDET